MTHTIKYPIKFYLFNLILYSSLFIVSIIGFCVLFVGKNLWAVASAIILLIGALGLFDTICNVQWIKIDNEYISAYNIFGLVKRLELSKIQTCTIVNAVAFSVRMFHQLYPCIVISHRKSLIKAGIENTFNKKKNPYIILPYSEETKLILKKMNLPPLKNPNSP